MSSVVHVLEYFFGESSEFIKCTLNEHSYKSLESAGSGSCRPNLARLITSACQLEWAYDIPSNSVTAGLLERASERLEYVTGVDVLGARTVAIERADCHVSKRNNPESVELKYTKPPVLR